MRDRAELSEDVAMPTAPRPPAPSGAAVACEDVALAYGAKTVLRDVTFAVRPGERAAVLGPNGGGKTTLFRALTGELEPVAGRVVAPDRCGVVPQTERSRLDFPVSALDVALMGAVSRLEWWRRRTAPAGGAPSASPHPRSARRDHASPLPAGEAAHHRVGVVSLARHVRRAGRSLRAERVTVELVVARRARLARDRPCEPRVHG